MLTLTVEQQRAIQEGQAVAVTVAGAPCVVLRKDIYERGEALDYSPWTPEETDCWLRKRLIFWPVTALNRMPHESPVSRPRLCGPHLAELLGMKKLQRLFLTT